MHRKHLAVLSYFFALTIMVAAPSFAPQLYAQESSGEQKASLSGLNENSGVGGSGSTILPDLFTGTLPYAVPIDVPPGRKGMAPKLALRYSSHATNGWVGYGWNLDIPYIQRQGPHKGAPTYDDNQDTFLFVSGDATIELARRDGTGEWGSNYYGAKIEGAFAKFLKNPSGGWAVTDKAGTTQFFGTTPASRHDDPENGTRIYRWYLDTVTDLNNNTITLAYTKETPEARNLYLNYSSANFLYIRCSQIYPNTISYASNTVRFDWESIRPDAEFTFYGGFCAWTGKRLKLIEVIGPSSPQLVKLYRLDYADFNTAPNQTAYSRLTTITQYDRNATTAHATTWLGSPYPFPAVPETESWTVTGNTLPSQRFDYSAKAQSFTNTSYWQTIPNWDATKVVADFNGDGKDDVAYKDPSNNNIYVALSTGQGFQTPTTWGVIQNWTTSRLVGDFNGDGKTDVVYRGTENNVTGIFVVYANQAATGFTAPTQLVGVPTATWDVSRDHGDFNGDGKQDVVYRSTAPTATSIYVTLANSAGTGFLPPTLWADIPKWDASRLVADFTGDGLTDIAYCQIASDTSCHLFIGRSNGVNMFITGTVALSAFPYSETDPYGFLATRRLGDFNGDGLMDLLVPGADIYPHGTLKIYLSNGVAFVLHDYTISPRYDTNFAYNGGAGVYTVADFNGDGLADVAYEASNDDVIMLLSYAGGGFFDDKSWGIVPGWGRNGASQSMFAIGDFNGDGMADVAGRANAAGDINVSLSSSTNPDLLATVQNGLGGITTITYKPSTQYQNNGKLPLVIQTVSSVKIDDGRGTVGTTQYSYVGGLFDFNSREFRGFNQVTVTDPGGTKATTWFYQGNPTLNESYALKGRPYETRVADSGGRLYSRAVNTWTVTAPFSAASLPELTQTDTFIHDGSTTALAQTEVQTVYDCDDPNYRPCYGNVKTVSNLGQVAPQNVGPVRYQTTEYALNTSAWIVGLPSHQFTTDAIGTKLSETWFFYDGTPNTCASTTETAQPTKGNLTLVRQWFGSGTSPQVLTGYDAYGNPVCTKDPKGTLTTITYDLTNTFPLETIIQDGHSGHLHRSTTQYYGVNTVPMDTGLWGQVKSVTDPNLKTATTFYDTFGRKIQMLAPDGGSATTQYLNLGDPTQQRIRTITPDGSTDGLWAETYLDGLGRTYKTLAKGPSGTPIRQETTYNQRGLVSAKSMPYFDTGETRRDTTMTYDSMGRVIQTTAPDGTTATVAYNGLTVTTTDPNSRPHRETKDADGRLIQVDEYGNDTVTPSATTYYQYDLVGNLVKVTDAQNHLTTMRYDNLGRKIAMADPDMGSCGDLTVVAPPNATFPWYNPPCWSYDYDANGNLVRQMDARGQVIYFQYDPLNRVLQKDFTTQKPLGSGDVVYTYDSSTTINTIGRLAQVQDASGSTSFQYDPMGRVTQSVKTVNGDLNPAQYPTGYLTKTQYDTLGRITTLTYPAPVNTTAPFVTYSYNPAGGLFQIKEGSAIYATYPVDQYTALGQPKKICYGYDCVTGAGTMTTYTYRTDNSRLERIQTQQMTNTTVVATHQDLTYAFDPAGNVTRVVANTSTGNEDRLFAYDGLHRLLQATYRPPTGSATTYLYAYDAIGNMTTKSQGATNRTEENNTAVIAYQNTGAPPVTVENTSPAISYEKRIVNWTTTSQSQASGGSYAYSNAAGDTASVVFTGTSVQWLSAKSKDSGMAQVYLDGVLQGNVDLYCGSSCGTLGQSSALYQQAVWSATNLTNTTHLLDLIVTGTKNNNSNGAYVTVDAVVVGTNSIQESSPAVTLESHVNTTWDIKTNTAASGGSFSMTNDQDAVVSARFTGTGIQWLAVTSSEGKRVDVYLDGVYQATVDLCPSGGGCGGSGGGSGSAQYQQIVWSRTGLVAGLHLFKLTPTPSQTGWGQNNCGSCIGNVTLDALNVLPAAGGPWQRTEDSSLTLDYGKLNSNTTGWSTVNDGAASGGSYQRATTSSPNGTEATYTFSGYGIAWKARTDNLAGKAEVWLDGALQATVDLYSATPAYPQQPVWSRTDLSNSPHTLTIVVTGTKNPSSGGTNVYLDALWTYNAQGWHAVSDATASGGQTYATDQANATATVTFTGTGISWLAPVGPTGGAATVAVYTGTTQEGPAQTVSLTNPLARAQQIVYTKSGLSNTPHTLLITTTSSTTTSGTPITGLIDAFDVTGALTENVTCTYTNPDHVHAVNGCTGSQTEMMIYGATGNQTQDVNGATTQTYTWDAQNRLSGSTITTGGTVTSTASFVYDGDGGRVKKVDTINGVTTSTVYIGKLYECTPSGCSRYVFAGDQRIAIKDATGMHYYHTDHLGSSTVITEGNGALYQALAYAPYGQIRYNSRGNDSGMHHKYTGQERDDSTGLDFYNARYYASGLHRFVSPDTIVPNFADPQTLNRYAYVRNNPLKYTDPSGHFFFELIMMAVVFAAVNASINVAIAAATGGDLGKAALAGAISGAILGPAGFAASMAPAGVDLFVLYMGGAAAGAASSAAVGGNAALGAWMGGFSTLVGGGANLGLGAMGVNGSIGQGLGQIGAGAVGGGLAAMAMGESFGDGARVGAISAAITFGARTMAAYVARGAAVKSTNGQSQRTAVALAVVGTCVPGTACNPDVDWGVGILKGDTFYARVEWGMQDLENGPSFVGLRYWTTPNGDAWYDNGVAGFGFREYPAFIEQMMQTGRAGGQWTIPLPYGTTGVVFWTNNPSNAGTYDPAIKPWGMTFEFH